MLGFKTKKKLSFIEGQARATLLKNRDRARISNLSNVNEFGRSSLSTLKLIMQEKEIIVFAILQWLTIALGYFAFIQIIDWIPDELWRAVDTALEKDQESPATIVGLIMMGWLFLIVVLTSYPIGIFNSAMAATHFMRQAYGFSSVITTLSIAQKNQARIWAFTTADSWITVNAIIDRLPKKRNNRTIVDEVLYYAWKLGTMCMIPGLINGKGLVGAGKESLLVIKKEPMRAISLRFGYSLICWILGILIYFGIAAWLSLYDIEWRGDNWLYICYRAVFLPLVVSVGFITVFIRPFFLLGATKLYTDVHDFDKEHIEDCITSSGSLAKVIALLAIFYGLLVLAIFANKLGFQNWIEIKGIEDLKNFS